MTLQQCTKILAPLAVTLGVELDEPDFRAYFRALQDVPLALFAQACDRAARAPRDRFEPRFPTAPKLREWAEDARRAASKALAWRPCDDCTHGWVDAGEGRVRRCACWHEHQARITGVATPLQLPAPEREEAWS